MDIKYLDNNEKLSIRPLYEKTFDDSQAYTDYLFNKDIFNKDVLVLMDNNEIISMLSLVKKKVIIRGLEHTVHYIYAVATDVSFRGKGYMGMLLNRAIEDLKEVGEPFVYLVPVDENVYTRFGFETVYRRKICRTSDVDENEKIYSPSHSDIKIMKALFENEVKDKYDTYLVHDEKYFQKLFEEIAIEGGYVYFNYDNEEIVGYTIAVETGIVIENIGKSTHNRVRAEKEVPWVMIKQLDEKIDVGSVFINDET